MNIIIVEDDNLTRNNLENLLNGEASIQRVEAFPDSEKAIQSADWSVCDILLTDIDLPNMNGVELISWAQLNHPSISCMAHTIYDNRDTVFAAIQAGACGYLLKGASPRVLIESIQEIFAGGSPMSPQIARKVIRHLQNQPVSENLLTPREQAVLKLLEQGLSYKETADELTISPHTVHSYIKSSYEKVQASSRQELINKARRLGWI